MIFIKVLDGVLDDFLEGVVVEQDVHIAHGLDSLIGELLAGTVLRKIDLVDVALGTELLNLGLRGLGVLLLGG